VVGVTEVDEVLAGQRDEALVQDRQPADAGVEDGDRELAAGVAIARDQGLTTMKKIVTAMISPAS
jgi:hypothetical protein